MRLKLRAFGAAVSLAVSVGAAEAASFTFTGSVTGGGGAFTPGDTLTGSFSFDEGIAPRAGSDATTAVFDSLTALDISIGAFSASFLDANGGPELETGNDEFTGNDRFAIVSRASDGLGATNAPTGLALQTFIMRLDDNTLSFLSSALDLPAAFSLASFSAGSFFLFFVNDAIGDVVVFGSIDVAAVPLPATLPLAFGGLAVFGFLARRRAA